VQLAWSVLLIHYIHLLQPNEAVCIADKAFDVALVDIDTISEDCYKPSVHKKGSVTLFH
jgi:hypothetical protein